MRNLILFTLIALISACKNSSQISKETDQVAFYSGYLQCEECGKVFVQLELKNDNTCIITDTEESDSPETKLTMGTWKKENNLLHIKTAALAPSFKMSNNQISIAFDENYTTVLEKTNGKIDLSQPFIARGEFFYYADASTFTICNGKRYPVAYTEAHYEAEKMFLSKKNEKIYIDMLISIETKPNQDKIIMEQVFIHRVLNEAESCL
jgi:hypothetical protein